MCASSLPLKVQSAMVKQLVPPRMIFNAILDWWQWTPTKRQTSILFCQMVRFGWFGLISFSGTIFGYFGR